MHIKHEGFAVIIIEKNKRRIMLVPFEKLDPQSKIWIYQSDRKFNQEECEFITQNTESFLVEWTAHGNSLAAGMCILHNQFIIIGVNETVHGASGCSIDKSFQFIGDLGNKLNVNLLERSKVAIRKNAQLQLIEFTDIKKMISAGVISNDTEVFNNTIGTKTELDENWVQSAKDSWLKRYF